MAGKMSVYEQMLQLSAMIDGAAVKEASHPSENMDNGSTSVPVGEHSRWLDARQKELGLSIPDATNGPRQSQAQLGDHSIQGSLVLEDKSLVNSLGTGVKEPSPTESPASVDKNEKYASYTEKYASMKFDDIVADCSRACDRVLSSMIAVQKHAQSQPPAPAATPSQNDDTIQKLSALGTKHAEEAIDKMSDMAKEAAEAGFEAGFNGITWEDYGRQLIVNTVKEAALAADLVAAELRKQAEEMPAQQPPIPPEAAIAAPPPAAAAGHGGGSAGSAGGFDQETIEALLQEMMAAGITPEELLQMLQGAQGAGGGSPPGGAMPAADASQEAPAMKEAEARRQWLASIDANGLYRSLKDAAESGTVALGAKPKNTKQAELRSQSKEFLKELLRK